MLKIVRSMFQPGSETAPGTNATAATPAATAGGDLRHSNGLREFFKGWDKAEGLRVLDLGCTSSANLNFFTERGHGIHSDDLLLEAVQSRYKILTDAGPGFNAELFIKENLVFAPERFDAILLWDLVDYMPENLVKPLVDRLTYILKPGGTILSYFHTKDAGPDAAFYRYHIHDEQTLQLRRGSENRLQRIFNNRHVENLFRGYRSIKFFLARDNLREVLSTK